MRVRNNRFGPQRCVGDLFRLFDHQNGDPGEGELFDLLESVIYLTIPHELYKISAYGPFYHTTRAENFDPIRESGLLAGCGDGMGAMTGVSAECRVYLAIGEPVCVDWDDSWEELAIEVDLEGIDESNLCADDDFCTIHYGEECIEDYQLRSARDFLIKLRNTGFFGSWGSILTEEAQGILINWMKASPSDEEIDEFLKGPPEQRGKVEWWRNIWAGHTVCYDGVIPPERLTVISE